MTENRQAYCRPFGGGEPPVMRKSADPENPDASGDVDVDDLLLGKRYENADHDGIELVQTAQMLGFSAKEVLELERVYLSKSIK